MMVTNSSSPISPALSRCFNEAKCGSKRRLNPAISGRPRGARRQGSAHSFRRQIDRLLAEHPSGSGLFDVIGMCRRWSSEQHGVRTHRVLDAQSPAPSDAANWPATASSVLVIPARRAPGWAAIIPWCWIRPLWPAPERRFPGTAMSAWRFLFADCIRCRWCRDAPAGRTGPTRTTPRTSPTRTKTYEDHPRRTIHERDPRIARSG